ncbi:hypothetical protein BASA60_008715 [Batrachochytrium salamandrivorans]|nr:hypothetical protein BASA60_008715 [Batrachochytrium salamandrivorans]
MYILGSGGGVLNGEADLDQRWLDGTVEHESMGTRHDNRALLVSRVESYKYIGVLIDSKLDHSAWLKQNGLHSSTPFRLFIPVLANHQLTVNYRSRIFSAVVMGKAYYGLELVGGNKSHLAPLQTTINKGIRLFTGARLSTAIGPLLVETGIGSLLTRSLVSRVRLLERSVTKRTPINAICSGTDNDVFTLNVQGQLVRSQRWFWSRRTKQLYRNRYWLTPQVRPKTVKQRHSFALMETLRTCGDSASLQKYVTRQLLDTSGFFKDPSFDQSRAHGTRYLMLARMDALWTARKAIQIGILVDTHPFSSGLVPAIQKSRLRLLGRALDPGVENVYTWLRGGVLNGEADLDQRWLDGTVEHESMGTRHDNRALAARLADFLQYEYLGVIIDDLLTLSPWLVKKKRAITAAVHSISPLLRNNFLFTRYRLTIFNGLVLGVTYYGLELIGGNSTLACRLQAPVNTCICMILKAPLFTPIAPMPTDCGIISLDAHAILARVRLTVKATTLKTPLQTLLLPSTIPSHSSSWFWTRRSRSLIRSVHPNINTTTPTTIPSTPTTSEIRHQHSKYAFERTFQVWGKSKLACSYVQANHASSAKFLRSPALSTGQAIGASLPSLVRCGGLWDYPRALKAGLLHPIETDPNQLGSPSLCILCHSQLDCRPMAHLVVDCSHPTVFFARVDTQLLQAINDTRVQISDCTLHTTTTATTTTTPASPNLSITSINSSTYTTGTSAIWGSMGIHTPIDNYQYSPRPTPQSAPSSSSSSSDFSFSSFFHFSPDTRFEPQISVAHSKIPRQAQDTVEENTTASRTTTTDTHTAAISSTPTPTHISYVGSDDILTLFLGGAFLALTIPGILKHILVSNG